MKRRSPAAIGALAAALALSACAAKVSTERPPVPIPAAWTQPAPPAAGATFPAAGWWRSFGSLELEKLVALAERNNPDLAAAGYRIAQATAQARVARAGLFPSLDLGGDASRSWRGELPGADDFGIGLDAAYEIDLWGRNRLIADSAVASRIASAFDRDTVALSLVAEVATTYFQYLSLADRMANARQILATAERILALVEAQSRIGVVSDLEVAQQRGAVASLRANLPALEQQRQQSLNALAGLLGTTAGTLAIEGRSLATLVLPAAAPGLPSAVLERRPDLRAAEAALIAARADTGAARAAMFPAIRLTGSAGYTSEALSSLFTPEGFFASIAANLVQPIFDAGRLAGEHQLAKARQAELVETYRSAVIAAFQDVEDALAAARYLAEVEAAQQEATAQARRAYELAEIRYRAGLVDFLAVLDTQNALFQQQDALVQTRLARLVAAVDLLRALGGGW